MSFLTPQVFDVLVFIVIIVGLVAAAIRIRNDFHRGPRWPEHTAPPAESETTTTGEEKDA
jgi:uncharacterized membrane protein YagU involved in acid resistance